MDQALIARKLCPVVHDDGEYLFVSKPAGLASGPTGRGEPATVLDLLSERADGGPLLPLYQVNTWQSGLVGFARSEEARRHLVTGLQTGSVKPVHEAVVRGRVKPQAQTVSAGLRQVDRNRFCVDRKATHGPLPTTRFEPLERHPSGALLRCRPDALNHHQIRAHLESLGLRVVGDDAYRRGSAKVRNRPIMLHLAELRFHHPGRKRAVTVRAKRPADFPMFLGLDARDGPLDGALTARLRAALAARLPCFDDPETNAFRLLNGRADGVSGLVAELYDDVLILQVHQGKLDVRNVPPAEVAGWYQRQLGLTAGYAKFFAKDRSRSASGPDALRRARPAVGRPAPGQFAIREHALRFLVRPYDGHSVGLFLDHRENRRRVRELASGRRVLNLFSYTCGFSVAAAAGGAEATVSVDISKKCLEWGKENFRVNGLPLERHTFIHDDAFNYFKRARRQQRRFDLIVIDPPSFARSKKSRRVFTVADDLRDLVAGAVSVLSPDGLLLVSTNLRAASRNWLREQVAQGASPRRASEVSAPRPPADFAGGRDGTKTIIVRVG